MQAISDAPLYDADMPKNSASPATAARLKTLREAAGLSIRELARQIDEQHTNILFWEKTGTLPRSNVLILMARALGVTVEELLGEPKSRRVVTPGGRLRPVFEAASHLPRREQQKLVEFVKLFVTQHGNGHKQAA